MTTILYFFWDGFSSTTATDTVSNPYCVAASVYHPGSKAAAVYHPGIKAAAVLSEGHE